MININDTTVAVETSAELKSVLESDNNINLIYLPLLKELQSLIQEQLAQIGICMHTLTLLYLQKICNILCQIH